MILDTLRCGNADHRSIKSFTDRMAVRWRDTEIVYYAYKPPKGISLLDFQDVTDQAMRAWANICGITVRRGRRGETPDIEICTGGPGDGFDGPQGTLAWCYLPNGQDKQLRCRLDPDEQWSLTRDRGIFMLAVMTHELGHGLGLEHSQIETALMAPYYSKNVWTPQQHDDIPRIQALYGPPLFGPVNPKPKPPGPTEPTMPANTLDITLNIPFIGKATGVAVPRANLEMPLNSTMPPEAEAISLGGIIGLLPKLRTLVPAVTGVIQLARDTIAAAKAGNWTQAGQLFQQFIAALVAIFPQIMEVVDILK